MNKKDIFRYIVLVGILILFSLFAIRHYILGGKVAPSVDALCPFGGFESLYTYITTGKLVPAIFMSSMVLAAGILLLAFFFRRGFCGWICPFGTMQELLGKITRKKHEPKIDRHSRYIKYIILASILIGTAVTGTLVFRKFDPFITFFHFGKGILWQYNAAEMKELIVGFVIAIVVLGLSIFIPRFWCRYLCPLGAVEALLSKISISKIKRDKGTCINCKACDKICPMKINVSKPEEVNDTECIDCFRCVDVCPKKSLSVNIFGKKVSTYIFVGLMIAMLIATIIVSMSLGVWKSTPTLSSDNINPEEIKGWMTIQDISTMLGVDAKKLVEDLKLPSELNLSTPMKDIGSKYGISFETETVREYVRNKEYLKSQDVSSSCPFGLEHDSAPGSCGLFADGNKDSLCDYG
jgi:NapH/MauN family ferredoxin-type protein